MTANIETITAKLMIARKNIQEARKLLPAPAMCIPAVKLLVQTVGDDLMDSLVDLSATVQRMEQQLKQTQGAGP